MMTHDEGAYRSGKDQAGPGDFKWADDAVFMYLQGTTHIDALGHAWYGDKLYNGYSSDTGIGGLSKASVQPLAERGMVEEESSRSPEVQGCEEAVKGRGDNPTTFLVRQRSSGSISGSVISCL